MSYTTWVLLQICVAGCVGGLMWLLFTWINETWERRTQQRRNRLKGRTTHKANAVSNNGVATGRR